MINSVTVAGNTTRDVEIRRTQTGTVIASFGIAVNERRKNGQTGQWDDYVNFFDVTAFGERWAKLAEFIRKGTKVTVQGKLRYSSWQDNKGGKHSMVEIVADEVELPPKQRQDSVPNYVGNAVYQEVPSSVYDADIPF